MKVVQLARNNYSTVSLVYLSHKNTTHAVNVTGE